MLVERFLRDVPARRVLPVLDVVVTQIHLKLGVPDLVEHLRVVALPQLLVLHRGDEPAGGGDRLELGVGQVGQRQLHAFHEAWLHLAGDAHPQDAVEEAVGPVVLLGFHLHVVADQHAERVLARRRDRVPGGVLRALVAHSELPVVALGLLVHRFQVLDHRDRPALRVVSRGSDPEGSLNRWSRGCPTRRCARSKSSC